MIKKILFVMVVVSLVATTCFAKISSSQIALGGLRPGVTLEYAESIYGPPKILPINWPNGKPKNAPSVVYQFGDSFYCWSNFLKIYTDANNSISTPDGITVGSSEADVINKYGQPDDSGYKNPDGQSALGFKPYDYILTYHASDSNFLTMMFNIKSGKVVYIEIMAIP